MPTRRFPALVVMLLVALISLASGPAGADPTATADPARGLKDRQVVHVHATGLPPNTVIAVVQCARGATSSANCEGQTADVTAQTDGRGVLDLDYTVFTLPSTLLQGTSIECDEGHPCNLFVGLDVNDFRQPHTFVPVAFGEAAAHGPSRQRAGSGRRLRLAPIGAALALAAAGGGVRVARRRRSAVRRRRSAARGATARR